MSLLSRMFATAASNQEAWIDVEALAKGLTDTPTPLVVDVRNPDEFTGPLGHIEGARNIPLPTFQAQLAALAQDTRPVVLVCHTDRRSSMAAAALRNVGKHDVLVLRGGMVAWTAQQPGG